MPFGRLWLSSQLPSLVTGSYHKAEVLPFPQQTNTAEDEMFSLLLKFQYMGIEQEWGGGRAGNILPILQYTMGGYSNNK